MTHDELKEKALKQKSVKEEYDALKPEYELLRSLLAARRKTGMSQREIAEKMGTKAPAITRLERSLINGKHSPSIMTIKKYAQAIGYNLEIRLVKN